MSPLALVSGSCSLKNAIRVEKPRRISGKADPAGHFKATAPRCAWGIALADRGDAVAPPKVPRTRRWVMFGEHTTTVLIGTVLLVLASADALLLWKTKAFRGRKNRVYYMAGMLSVLLAISIDFCFHLMVSLGLEPAPAIHAAVAPLLFMGVMLRLTKARNMPTKLKEEVS